MIRDDRLDRFVGRSAQPQGAGYRDLDLPALASTLGDDGRDALSLLRMGFAPIERFGMSMGDRRKPRVRDLVTAGQIAVDAHARLPGSVAGRCPVHLLIWLSLLLATGAPAIGNDENGEAKTTGASSSGQIILVIGAAGTKNLEISSRLGESNGVRLPSVRIRQSW